MGVDGYREMVVDTLSQVAVIDEVVAFLEYFVSAPDATLQADLENACDQMEGNVPSVDVAIVEHAKRVSDEHDLPYGAAEPVAVAAALQGALTFCSGDFDAVMDWMEQVGPTPTGR